MTRLVGSKWGDEMRCYAATFIGMKLRGQGGFEVQVLTL